MRRACAAGLCLLMLIACDRLPQLRLRDIETYVDDRPDSALMVLQSLNPVLPGDKARHALLTSIALDKSYIDVTNDSIIQVALRWYDSHGPAEKRMKAWYYLGRVQMNGGNTQNAIVSLEQAREVAQKEGDQFYLGLIERAEATAYYQNYYSKEAISHIRNAIMAFNGSGKPLYADYAKFSYAEYCILEGWAAQSDSILFGLLNRLTERDRVFKAEIYLRYASSLLLREDAQYKTAIAYFNLFRSIRQKDVPVGELFHLAEAYRREGQVDSADACLARAQLQAVSPLDSIKLWSYYYNTAAFQGDYQSANEYLQRAVKIQDRLVSEALEQSVETAMKNYYQTVSAERKNQIRKQTLHYALLFSLLLAVCVLLVWKNWRNKRLLELEILEHHELTEQLKNNQDTVVKLISQRVDVITRLLEQYEQLKKPLPPDASHFDREESAQEKLKRFHTALAEFRNDADFILGLEEGLNVGKKGIMRRLRNCFGHQLKEEDYKILALLFAGIDAPGISYVTGLKIPTIRVRKSRYKERFLKLEDGPDKALFLEEIAPKKAM